MENAVDRAGNVAQADRRSVTVRGRRGKLKDSAAREYIGLVASN
jgi:hypothetical protein